MPDRASAARSPEPGPGPPPPHRGEANPGGAHPGGPHGPARVPRRIILVRAVIGAFIVLLAALESVWIGEDGSRLPAFAIMLWTVASSWWLHRQREGAGQGILLRATLLGDALAAALAVHASGSIHSPTLLLLALPVLAAGLVAHARFGFFSGILTAGLYGLMAFADRPASVTVAGLWMRVGFHGLFFGSMGAAAGWLAQRMANTLREAAETRVALEEIRLSTDRIVESMGCGLVAVDADGLLRSLNPEARHLLRLPESATVLPARLVGANQALFSHLRASLGPGREACDTECVLTRSDGGDFPAWVKVTPVIDPQGRTRGAVGLFWDMSARKALERKAGERERMAMIGELSAGLAHEMRNSLKPISGSVDLLQRMGAIGEQTQAVFELIEREADSLEAFLSQFLTLSRDKTLKLEWIDLEDFIRQEARALAVGKTLDSAGLEVVGATGLGIYGDREWLRQVFRNLLLNAFEAVPGGTVRVWLESLAQEGRAWVRVWVCDEGPGLQGVSEEEAFRPFCTTKPAGSGLGLAIAQRGVHEHEGRIGFGERPAAGGGVFVDLPVDGPTPREQDPAAA